MGALKLCVICGEPTAASRCNDHQLPRRPINTPTLSTTQRGYGHAWQQLAKRARSIQQWCNQCGTTEDLTTDHLVWPARTLKDVQVLCRHCNSSKGKAPRNPREGTLDETPHVPGGKAFYPTHREDGLEAGA
jgi:5-methylcytosine-specific restriction endonuclease McrA